jgi:hypothetical protein
MGGALARESSSTLSKRHLLEWDGTPGIQRSTSPGRCPALSWPAVNRKMGQKREGSVIATLPNSNAASCRHGNHPPQGTCQTMLRPPDARLGLKRKKSSFNFELWGERSQFHCGRTVAPVAQSNPHGRVRGRVWRRFSTKRCATGTLILRPLSYFGYTGNSMHLSNAIRTGNANGCDGIAPMLCRTLL